MSREMDIDPNLSGIRKFYFTRNWFRNRNLETFRKYVHPEWAGKPITYLEIGVFEGMSMVWMLQHVLTHPDAYAVGVDPWLITRKLSSEQMEDVRQRAIYNTRWSKKCFLQRGNSVEVLGRMIGKGGFAGIKPNSVSVCMIDGDHNSSGCVSDANLCMRLLKPGGWMLFDDVENDKEKKDHVKQALEIFLEQQSSSVEFIWKHRYMEAYRKK